MIGMLGGGEDRCRHNNKEDDTVEEETQQEYRTITEEKELLQMGICRVRIPKPKEELQEWANEFSQVTPEIIFQQDSSSSFYRNILDQANPIDAMVRSSVIGQAIQTHFSTDELILDDAFCIQYTSSQWDTSCAKHVDPSDITVNLCLEGNTHPGTGSQVVFYGQQSISTRLPRLLDDHSNVIFGVNQTQGYATIHWGRHPHKTTPLRTKQGDNNNDGGVCHKRTNIILTYCFKHKKDKHDIMNQNCFFSK